jgi:hypothetical protein
MLSFEIDRLQTTLEGVCQGFVNHLIIGSELEFALREHLNVG